MRTPIHFELNFHTKCPRLTTRRLRLPLRFDRSRQSHRLQVQSSTMKTPSPATTPNKPPPMPLRPSQYDMWKQSVLASNPSFCVAPKKTLKRSVTIKDLNGLPSLKMPAKKSRPDPLLPQSPTEQELSDAAMPLAEWLSEQEAGLMATVAMTTGKSPEDAIDVDDAASCVCEQMTEDMTTVTSSGFFYSKSPMPPGRREIIDNLMDIMDAASLGYVVDKPLVKKLTIEFLKKHF